MNGDGTWLGEASQAGDNEDESGTWVRNTEENWFNNPQPLHHNDLRFSGGLPLNPSENLLLLLQQQSIDTSSPLQHFTLDSAPQQQQQEQSFLATKACFTSLLNVPTSNNNNINNNPFDELGFSSGFLGQTHVNQTPNFSQLCSPPHFLSSRPENTTGVGNRFTPLEFAGITNGVFENRAKVLKPLDVLASPTSQPTLFQKRAAMRQSSSSKTCNSESSSEMRRSSYERENLDDASTGITDIISDEHNNNNNKGKKKGMPAKNLMAERRRRKKLNDRLYMLRSVVPKISKMDRASILGDAIDYLKELLQRINDLHTELESTAPPSSSSLHPLTPTTQTLSYRVKEELCPSSSSFPSPRDQQARIEVKLREGKAVNIHMFCGRRPGLLLSTMRALDNLGLDVQQAVVSCFNGFALDVFRAEFNIPNLRVGTLDSLLALGDDLLKSNSFVEGVSQKIRRQIEELERISGVESNALTVDGVPVDSYLTRFVWDEAKYPTMSPLKEVVENIQSQVAKIEDDLKVRVAEYNNVRGQLNAINRKQSGSLAVRDLSNLVKPEDIVASEHLVTLLAVVPKYSQKDWLACYETLTEYVVPRSSKKLFEDNEYALYTVTLFTRVADNFRTSAREKGFQVRDFEHSVEAQETRKQELEKLVQDQESLRTSLLQWCYTSYGEVFSSWMHFCAVRIFAESIMRYGLPPAFLACVLSPAVKSEKKVRSILERLCDSTNSLYWKSEEDGGAAMAGLAGDSETHPYVSFTINLA